MRTNHDLTCTILQDMRMKFVDDDAGAEVQKGQDVKKDQGVARAISVSLACREPTS